MHLLESRQQREYLDSVYPQGPVHFLDEIGMLSPRLSVAHAVWLREDEMELLAARGVTIAVNVVVHEVSGEATPRVRCDASAIGRALSNLLENAVDGTPGGGEGSVTVSVEAHGKDAVYVDVVNEPACVPREVRGHLFERAVTARRDARGSGRGGRGTGLGLAIARAAVEAHGGRVTFVEMGPPRVRVRVELPR